MFNFSNFSNLFTPNMFGNSFVSGFSINSFGSNPSYSGFGASNSIYSTFSNCGYTNTNNGYVGYQVGSAVMSVLSLGATALLNKKMTENSSQSAKSEQVDNALLAELNKISKDATVNDYKKYDITKESEYIKLSTHCDELQAELQSTMSELNAAEDANTQDESKINELNKKVEDLNSKIKKANEDLKAYEEKREQEIENAQTKIRELLEQKAVLEKQSIRNEAVKNNGCILTRAPKKDVAAKYENANYEGTVTLSELRTATNEYAKACKKGDVESREKWAKVLRNMKKDDVDNIAEGNSAYKSLAALRDQAEAWLNH